LHAEPNFWQKFKLSKSSALHLLYQLKIASNLMKLAAIKAHLLH